MDNHGSEVDGQYRRPDRQLNANANAEAFTAEIEQATNAELEWKLKQSGITPDVARKLGSTVVLGEGRASRGPESIGQTEGLGQAMSLEQTGSLEQVESLERTEGLAQVESLAQAEREILRDRAELEDPEAYVGDESRLQIEERSEEDQEDLQREMGEGLKFEVKAMQGGQEEVAKVVMPEVDKILNQPSFRVRDLEDLYHEGVNKMLLVFNRRIGDRNGMSEDSAKSLPLGQTNKIRPQKRGRNEVDIVSLGQHLDEREQSKVVKNVA